MSKNHFPSFTANVVPLQLNDVDTDQIIPARFLKVTDKVGIGAHLFADWRYNARGEPKKEFAINKPEYQGAQILLAGHNFGCGSSREHAIWALTGFGFRAVISSSFADIFRGNALKNGLLPIVLEPRAYETLTQLATGTTPIALTVSLEHQSVTLSDGTAFTFPIDAFSKHSLLNGTDEMGYLLSFEQQIAAYEAQHQRRI